MLFKGIIFFSVVFFLVGCAAKEEIKTVYITKEVSVLDTEKKETITDAFYEKLKIKKPKSIEKAKLYDFGYMYFNKEEK